MDPSVVHTVFWVCGLLLVISAVEHHARGSAVPPACWLLLLGAAYGGLRTYAELDLPALHLGPEVVLFLFVPLILFDASRRLRVCQLWEVLPQAGLLGIVGPLAGMALLGLPLMLIKDMALTDAFLFGAVLSATDPVAVTAVFQTFRVPARLRALLEGESLLNDGTAVILFGVFLSRVSGGAPLSIPATALNLAGAILGALALGALAGAAGALLMRLWHALHDRFLGALLPLVVVLAVFSVAEHVLHVSGVVAVLAATLTMGALHIHLRRDTAVKEGGRAGATEFADRPEEADRFFADFWGFLGQLATAVLFFLVGARTGEHVYDLSWHTIPIMLGALLLSRAAIVYPLSAVFRPTRLRVPGAWQHVLALGGLRGALSVALLLSLAEAYPHRHLFLCLAFTMVLFTVVVNTLLLRAFLKHTGISDAEP